MGWLSEVWAKLKVLVAAIGADCVDTYKRLKILIIAILAALVYLEWERIKAALLVYQGKKEINSDSKQDQTLAQKEQLDIQQANALEQQANQLPNSEKPVQPDWYKKETK